MIKRANFSVPADVEQMLGELRRDDGLADRSNGIAGANPDSARRWLERILVDPFARAAHTDWLRDAYAAQFLPSSPRRLLHGTEPRRAEPDSRFPHRDLLPSSIIEAVLQTGVAALDGPAVSRLLLNPYALWDLSDLIWDRLPDHWLPAMDKVGNDLIREYDMDIPLPGSEATPLNGDPTRAAPRKPGNHS